MELNLFGFSGRYRGCGGRGPDKLRHKVNRNRKYYRAVLLCCDGTQRLNHKKKKDGQFISGGIRKWILKVIVLDQNILVTPADRYWNHTKSLVEKKIRLQSLTKYPDVG